VSWKPESEAVFLKVQWYTRDNYGDSGFARMTAVVVWA